jgi:hypothetical protein
MHVSSRNRNEMRILCMFHQEIEEMKILYMFHQETEMGRGFYVCFIKRYKRDEDSMYVSSKEIEMRVPKMKVPSNREARRDAAAFT